MIIQLFFIRYWALFNALFTFLSIFSVNCPFLCPSLLVFMEISEADSVKLHSFLSFLQTHFLLCLISQETRVFVRNCEISNGEGCSDSPSMKINHRGYSGSSIEIWNIEAIFSVMSWIDSYVFFSKFFIKHS